MNEKHFTLYSLFLLKAGDCTPFLHSVTLHSKNLIINAMKHLALKLALGATLLLIIGVASTTANTELSAGPHIDGMTCATPPERPAKKEKVSKPEKKQKKAKKAKKTKKTKETDKK